MEVVGVVGDVNSGNSKDFEGTIRIGLSSPFSFDNPARREFGFKVTDWLRSGSRVIFTDSGEVIADLNAKALEVFPIKDISAQAHPEFTPMQRRVLRYIAMGAQRGIFHRWYHLSGFAAHVLDGITKDDIRTVQVHPAPHHRRYRERVRGGNDGLRAEVQHVQVMGRPEGR